MACSSLHRSARVPLARHLLHASQISCPHASRAFRAVSQRDAVFVRSRAVLPLAPSTLSFINALFPIIHHTPLLPPHVLVSFFEGHVLPPGPQHEEG